MGQAPASGTVSLRTVPRNFPGRSGTEDDQVYLCSPETAACSALTGEITDPQTFAKRANMSYPEFQEPENYQVNEVMLIPPEEDEQKRFELELVKGPNIVSLPDLDPIEDELELPVLLKLSDNVSTDEILKAGADVLPLRSNIEAISAYAFHVIDQEFSARARKAQDQGAGHLIVAGENYAQGSSREHAALAPRYLGQKVVLAKSYARIGWQNLVNFGILPLQFTSEKDYDSIEADSIIKVRNIHNALSDGGEDIKCYVANNDHPIEVTHALSKRQCDVIRQGGMINYLKKGG